jgi:tetratricopeptide (TPR) repeat protein
VSTYSKNKKRARSHADWLTEATRARLLKLLICLALGLGTLAVYAPVRQYDFTNYDDDIYVTDNPHVLGGFTHKNVSWAFTHFHASNWHPLTWLSHMLDVKLWGQNAGGHHLTNVLIHSANGVLLFLVFNSMTGAVWRSALVAAVFAWHPLHVESVAWIAERKDVLSAFFWILTMAAYLSYMRKPRVRRYLLVVALFAGGLMSKSMVVTLPFVLLLLDYWPLRRAGLIRRDAHKWLKLFLGKIPLIALAILSAGITIFTQQRSGAIKSALELPWQLRISNALIGYVSYLGKALWPVKLAAFYPFPSVIPLWQVASAVALLLAITILTLAAAKASPYLAVGWFWYLGTLVPVIGLVQVGSQAMADRYSYIPLIGVATAGAWGAWELLKKLRHAHVIAGALFATTTLLMLQASARQIRHWHDSFTLFEHALAVTSDNWGAHNNLSDAFLGRPDGARAAADHAREAVRLSPNQPVPYMNLGLALRRLNKNPDAITQFERALVLRPDWPDAHQNLGVSLMLEGRVEEALPHFYEALRLDPEHVRAMKGLSWIRATQPDEKWRNAHEAVRLGERAAQLTNYKEAEALDVLAAALAEAGRYDEAFKTAAAAEGLARAAGQPALVGQIAHRMELYQLGLPYRTRR